LNSQIQVGNEHPDKLIKTLKIIFKT